QLEAADGAKAVNRWWREDGDERVLDATHSLVDLARDGATGELGGFAFLELVQAEEHDAGVRRIGEAIDRQSRERHRIFHAWGLHGDVRHTANHLFGAVERGAVGQLREADQVLLVLAGDESV